MIKTTTTLSKIGIEGNFLNLIKNIYEKPTVNIIFSGKKLKTFPLRSGTSQGYLFSPLVINIILKFLANSKRWEKEIHLYWLGRKKLYLFTDDTMVYVENLKKKSIQILVEPMVITEVCRIRG